MSTQNNVCAVVVTYNTGSAINLCVNAIKDQVAEVVVVDNGSGTTTIDELRRLEREGILTAIYNRTDLGIGKALNQGVQHAIQKRYRCVLCLDHDSVATPGWSKGYSRFLNFPEDVLGLQFRSPMTQTRICSSGRAS